MDSMPKSRLSAFLSLILLFSSGALVGAVGHRLYMVNTVVSVGGDAVAPAPPRRPSPEEARKRNMDDMKQRVHLDDKQIAQLNEIYDQTRDQFEALMKKREADGQAIRDSQTAKIRAILRPDQIPLYEQYRADREAQREAERKKHRQSGGGPPR
jgi:hypothetical protein